MNLHTNPAVLRYCRASTFCSMLENKIKHDDIRESHHLFCRSRSEYFQCNLPFLVQSGVQPRTLCGNNKNFFSYFLWVYHLHLSFGLIISDVGSFFLSRQRMRQSGRSHSNGHCLENSLSTRSYFAS
jgi:hypothetical protein